MEDDVSQLAIHAELSPLEVMLSVYTPILECLVKHLPTPSKRNLAQTSPYLRRLLLIYPPYYSHFDFRLSVYEAPGFDNYHLGTIYNLDKYISSLPLEKGITSLTLDWTAVTGLFLFGPLMSRCQSTLEHLSVRGCRKVSIKHHIVPYLVYQDDVEPYSVSTANPPPKRALKSLYVYKARGVRRKPFLIDRKPADGDEPSRYLTTLAEKLGIWTDLGLCPTPKLRCPRRREILRRGKEKYCVPFDKRWRVQDPDAGPNNPTLKLLSPHELSLQRREEERAGLFTCDNCEGQIVDRCEACVFQMTCAGCRKAICHECAYARPASPVTPSESGPAGNGIGATAVVVDASTNPPVANATNPQIQIMLANLLHINHPAAVAGQQQAPPPVQAPVVQPVVPTVNNNAAETHPVMHFLQPCCETASPNTADMLCGTCMASISWARCGCCDKQICVKHEYANSRKCTGGCDKVFCSTNEASGSPPGCGDTAEAGAGIMSCLTCNKEVCARCRLESLHAPPASDDDGDGGAESEVEEAAAEKVACDCKVCKANFYCTSCWPSKKTKCEPRPKEIVSYRQIDAAKSAYIYLVAFHEVPTQKWMTGVRIQEDYASTGGAEMLAGFKDHLDSNNNRPNSQQPPPPPPTPEPTDATATATATATRDSDGELEPEQQKLDARNSEEEVLVGEDEWIMEKIICRRIPHIENPTTPSSSSSSSSTLSTSTSSTEPPTTSKEPNAIYRVKWLGRPSSEATWEHKQGFAKGSRERALMDSFDIEGPIIEKGARTVKHIVHASIGVHSDFPYVCASGSAAGGGGGSGAAGSAGEEVGAFS